MTPAELMEGLEARLWGVLEGGRNPWAAGARLIGQRMGLEPQLALEGVLELGGGFARVVQVAGDPRRFRIAGEAERAAATPALLFGGEEDGLACADADDVVALSLAPGSRRFWRLTCDCAWLGALGPDGGGVLRLREDAHGFVGPGLKALAYRRRGREEGESALAKGLAAARKASGIERFADAITLPVDDPGRLSYVRGFQAALRARAAAEERWRLAARPPAGALILDPAAVDWTRRGALGDVERIEIVDAPEDGPLGRALKRLNPRIGTRLGVPLDGLERPRAQRRAA